MDENGNPLPNDEDLNLGVGGDDPNEPTGNDPVVPQPKPGEEEEQGQEEVEISNDPVNPPNPDEEEEQQPVSRRESKRVNQLLEKLSRAEQGNQQPQGRQPQGQQPNGQQIIPEGEYTTEQINGMAQDYGQRLYQMGLSTAQANNIAINFATRLEIDAPRVRSKYEFLDPENEETYNPGVTDFVDRMFLNTVGYDPMTGVVNNQDLRYNEFVDGFMDVVELVANGKVADATHNVARQTAQRGVRPGGNTKKPNYQGDDPTQMSDEQLDQAIATGLGIRPK